MVKQTERQGAFIDGTGPEETTPERSLELVLAVRTGFAEGATVQEHAAAQAAFTKIYNDNYSVIYSRTLGMVRDYAVAEDIVSDTFARAFGRLDTYRDEGTKIRAWLLKIAYHLTIDRVREQKRRSSELLVAYDDPDMVVVPSEDNSEEAALERVVSEQLVFALRSLSNVRQRQVIAMQYFAGLSGAEIAERLNIPEGTVKSAAFYGLRNLRKMLSGEPASPAQ